MLAFLLACAQLPEKYTDCDDTECRSAWVVERWKTDPDAVAAAVGAEPDEMVRIVLVRVLTDAYPGRIASLCGKLPAGPATDQCRTMNARPHLHSEAAAAKAKPKRTFSDVEPEVVDCATERKVCQMEAARQRVEAGDERGAAAACRAVEETDAQSECFFQAAEALMANGRQPDPVGVVRMCLGGERFQNNCLIHLTRSLSRLAPRSTETRPNAWSAATAAIEAARAELEVQGAAQAPKFPDWAWGQTLRASYSFDEEVTGTPLEQLPSEVAPQVRAAAAVRFYQLHFTESWTVDQWQERFTAALADRAPRPARERARTEEPVVTDRWTTRLPGEEEIPSEPWSWRTDRPFSEDPATDALICLLMAAGTDRRPDLSLLEGGLGHEDRLVRLTAAILLDELKVESSALAKARMDEDPLVRARAKAARKGIGPGR